ncbi:MAG: DMT family transporter [Pyrinomonadaceae bacterium]
MNATSRTTDNGLAPHVALIVVQILFGTWPVVGKIVLRSMSSPSLVTCRVVGGAMALILIQRKVAPLLRMPLKHFAWLTLCSMLGIVGNQFLFVKGLSLTTAINATLLGTTIPVFALFVSILFRYDRLSLRRTFGILLSGAGVVYLVNPFSAELATTTTAGNIVIVCNSFLYGAYIAISKGLFQRYGALNVITWIFIVGAVVAAPVGAYTLHRDHVERVGMTVWLALGFIVLFPTVGAYYLNAWALTKVAPSTVAVYTYLQPLIAFGLAPLILGESWNSRTIAASLLIFAGVAVVTRRGRSIAVREITEHPDALSH